MGEIVSLEYTEATMPFTALLRGFIPSPMVESICVAIITLISAVILMIIIFKHDVLRERDYLAAFIFILLNLSLPNFKQVSGAHIAVLFCLLSFNRLLSIYNKAAKSSDSYLSTLYIGVAGLFYPPALLYLPISLMGIALLKVFNWRDFFLGTFGTITPFIFAASYYHFLDYDIQKPIGIIVSYFTPGIPFFLEGVETSIFNIGYVYLAYIALIILIATILDVRGISASIKTSRILGILRLAIAVLLAAMVAFPAMQTSYMLILVGFPASILTASYFSGFRKAKVANVQLILFVISCILLQFYF